MGIAALNPSYNRASHSSKSPNARILIGNPAVTNLP
jgi:hypothetical protein